MEHSFCVHRLKPGCSFTQCRHIKLPEAEIVCKCESIFWYAVTEVSVVSWTQLIPSNQFAFCVYKFPFAIVGQLAKLRAIRSGNRMTGSQPLNCNAFGY